MKVRFVEFEGDGVEVGEALRTLVGVAPHTPPTHPAPLVAAPAESRVIDVPRMAPAPLAVVQEPAQAVNAATPVILDGRPRDWQEVPGELRVWNAQGDTCHIAKNPNDLYVTWCKHDVGQVRPADMEPRTQAKPCGNCLRRMSEAARP